MDETSRENLIDHRIGGNAATHGRGPTPILAISAGVHKCECAGPVAADAARAAAEAARKGKQPMRNIGKVSAAALLILPSAAGAQPSTWQFMTSILCYKASPTSECVFEGIKQQSIAQLTVSDSPSMQGAATTQPVQLIFNTPDIARNQQPARGYGEYPYASADNPTVLQRVNDLDWPLPIPNVVNLQTSKFDLGFYRGSLMGSINITNMGKDHCWLSMHLRQYYTWSFTWGCFGVSTYAPSWSGVAFVQRTMPMNVVER